MYRLMMFSTWIIYVTSTVTKDTTVTPTDNMRTNDTVDICVLVPFDDSRMFSFHRVLPAVYLAVSKVKSMGLVSGVELRIHIGDSGCSSRDGPIAAFEYYRLQQVSVFLGPVCDYSLAPVARYAPVWNIPVITPGGFAHDMSSKTGPHGEFPSLTRVGVTFNSLTDSVITIAMKVFRWTKMKLIYEAEAKSSVMPKFCYLAAAALVNTAKEKKMSKDFHIFLPGTQTIEDVLLKEVGDDYGSVLCTHGEYATGLWPAPIAGDKKLYGHIEALKRKKEFIKEMNRLK